MTDLHATPDRAVAESREQMAEALWRLWRGGYIETADLRAIGCGTVADAMERAANGD